METEKQLRKYPPGKKQYEKGTVFFRELQRIKRRKSMLTAKQNMIETIKGGNPDRSVNQYEAIKLLFSPFNMHSPMPTKGGPDVVNAWGVTQSFPENVPGGFPVHTPDKLVIKDIEHWQDYVKFPDLDFPQAEWDMFKDMYAQVDGDKAFRATFVAPGIFEQCHHLGDLPPVLEGMIEYPDEMHDLVKALTEWELKLADGICSNLHPEMIFHHDDWGSQKSTFMSVPMFEEFFLPAYKEVYGYYHDHGVEYVVHHSDSYAATFVPAMIEMGIDVWQGCFSTNNVPELIQKYGGKISFMGDIENMLVDFDGWTDANCREQVRKAIDECGQKYFIPCIAQGGPGSVFPGVYQSMTDAIDEYNTERFGFTREEIAAQRLPIDIMF